MNAPLFHFTALEAKLAEYRTDLSSRAEQRWVWLTVSGILVLTVSPKLLASSWLLAAVVVLGLVIEVIGIAGLVVLQLRETVPAIRNRRIEFAQVLDRQYAVSQEIVDWLRRHDADSLHTHLRYLRGHREVMRQKLGLMVGGIERLGVLPLLIALYLQVHAASVWPPHFTVAEMLMIWTLALAYGVGWWATSAVLRMDLYAQLLSDALDEDIRT